MNHKFCLIYEWFIRTLLYFFPDIPPVMRFRGFLYSFCLKKCGRNFQVTNNAILRSTDTISIGNNVYIANNCVILGGGQISIEDEVIIAPNTVIASRNHTKSNDSFRYGKSYNGSIEIKKGAWIAANCTIATDSCLPEASVLGANSLLNKRWSQPSALYAGLPAKPIKEI